MYIHTSEAIGKANSKKVLVNFTQLNEINSSSGADIHTTNFILSDNMVLNASSGSDQFLSVKAENIKCSASSGADIKLTGTTTTINADASSGADINAKKLISQHCFAKASSGADINLNCIKVINAIASSSADISYSGNPSEATVNKSSAASISKN